MLIPEGMGLFLLIPQGKGLFLLILMSRAYRTFSANSLRYGTLSDTVCEQVTSSPTVREKRERNLPFVRPGAEDAQNELPGTAFGRMCGHGLKMLKISFLRLLLVICAVIG